MRSYDAARADFEYLERLADLEDQVDLDSMRLELMQDPRKGVAAKMYRAGIQLWFSEHGRRFIDDRLEVIRARYGLAR